MRPYKAMGRRYRTVGSPPYGGVSRPSKLAAGMSATRARSSHERPEYRKDVSKLAVFGTTDELGSMINWKIARSKRVCPCCRQRINTVVLSDHGRRRLRDLRRKRNGT